jgi:hypothetical protein
MKRNNLYKGLLYHLVDDVALLILYSSKLDCLSLSIPCLTDLEPTFIVEYLKVGS